MRLPRLQLSFTVTLLTAFALVFALGVGAVVAAFRGVGQEVAEASAERELGQAARLVAARSRALFRPVLVAAETIAEFRPLTDAVEPGQGDVAALLDLLEGEAAIQAISVGRPDGALRQVLRAGGLARGAGPTGARPQGARFILRDSAAADAFGRHEEWTYLGADRRVLGQQAMMGEGADPRDAPWYRQARIPGAVQVSPLGDLALFGRPGLSVSNALRGGGVLALDITLDGLSAFLATQRASPRATLFLMDADGMLLAHQDPQMALQRLGDGRTTWLSLQAATDPLLRLFWDGYASGQLRPGLGSRIILDSMPMLVEIEPVADVAGPPLLAVVIAPLEDFTSAVLEGVRRGTLLGVGAMGLGLCGIGVLAWRVARPLGRLTREAEAIRRFELDSPIRLDSHIAEVQRLGAAMGAMKAALGNFSAYVPRDLVRQLVGTGEMAKLGGDRRPLTVMFTDVENFTDLAEKLEPEEVMLITSAYFDAMTKRLLLDGATIDKYIGDCVMALWNAPRRDAEHAARACLGALHAQRVSQRLEGEFAARGWPRLRTRFGVHTGEAVVGNVGSSDRLSYTAIGSMVNLASRLEGLNKYYGTGILISDAARRAAGDGFLCRSVDLVLTKGSHIPMEVFELLGTTDPADGDDVGVAATLGTGLDAWSGFIADYRAGHFAAARERLARWPDCAGSQRLRARYAQRLESLGEAAEPGWSPVISFDNK
ncbi:adenylate/guanylate cyclase domain-containing protein [Plastoroseomonas arctica]|uniref:Adenylate cyclase n=1 Tax=Plastoroseomonas arctica TaxID=1509237 RepID=A0AAF1K9I7_9PROT|nr:adenylate/guanylate cyclase domain-containing protein [Plastoroseomonas arctica]MBR0657546.1 hypothetical protein [Plastoroseomonas arctica]